MRHTGSGAGALLAGEGAPASESFCIASLGCAGVWDRVLYSYEHDPSVPGVTTRARHHAGHPAREALSCTVMREDDNSRARMPDG